MNEKMRYGSISSIALPVSRIVFGTAIPAMTQNGEPFELLDAVFESGINTFDTAASYGDSELVLGRWIASRGLRDRVVIVTKGAYPNAWRQRTTPFDLQSDLEDSFARLGTEFIDVYLIHRDAPGAPVGPLVELLNQYRQDRRIGAFGVSNWSAARVAEANEYAASRGLTPFQVVSPAYSLAEMIGDPFGTSIALNGDKCKADREWFRENKFPIFAYSGLARGFLSGKLTSADAGRAQELLRPIAIQEYAYPENFERLRRAETIAREKNASVPAIAMAWLLHQPLDVYPITSPGSVHHLRDVLSALDIALTPDEVQWLNLEI